MQSRWVIYLSVASLIGFATPVFSESAPVYDAETLEQQFENSGESSSQDFPPPPPPEQTEGFVPMQPQAAPVPSTSSVSSQAPKVATLPVGSSDQRLSRLEQQMINLQDKMPARIETLQTEVQSLRGQVEQLTRQLQLLKDQQNEKLLDLEKRFSQQGSQKVTTSKTTVPDTNDANEEKSSLESGEFLKSPPRKAPPKPDKNLIIATPKTPAVTKSAGSIGQPDVAEEQQIYQTAYDFIKAKKYSDAVNALEKMLQKYPSGQFASNAHYWLGELYGLMGKNDQALIEFSTVVKNYPDSPRISDAQLKVGLIYASQFKWSDAKSAFKKVINHFPGTASSRLATEQLKQIKQAGH